MVWGILGDLTFRAVESPRGLSDGETYQYAEHKVIEGKPRLQWTGDGLRTIKLDMRWARNWCEPVAMLETLRAMAATHAAHALVYGDGTYPGSFVIEGIDRTIKDTDPSGAVTEIEVSVSLKEWVGGAVVSGGATGPGVDAPSAVSVGA